MKKIKLENDKVRKAYYELSDKIIQANEVLGSLENSNISEKLKKIEELKDLIYQELENNYIWD